MTGPPVRSDEELVDAAALGLEPHVLAAWDGFHPMEIDLAVRHGLSVEDARIWADGGARVQEALAAGDLGLDRDEVAAWCEVGFPAADALLAAERGVALDTALAWRRAGFILPDAVLLLDDGWQLADAVVARDRSLGEHGRGAR